MKLLDDDTLEQSAIVANCRMNREIELAGPVIEAILKSEELRGLVLDGMLPEMEEFAEARL